jgi:hypothetical protein
MHPKDHNKERVSDLEQYENSLDTSISEFPVEYNRNIKKFEEVNNFRISIFCLEDKENKVYPLYVSNRTEGTRIDLGIYNQHYVLINKLEWILFPNETHKHFICRRCLCSTSSEEKLRKHEELCSDNPPCKIDFPKGNYLEFNDFDKLQWNHFVSSLIMNVYSRTMNTYPSHSIYFAH